SPCRPEHQSRRSLSQPPPRQRLLLKEPRTYRHAPELVGLRPLRKGGGGLVDAPGGWLLGTKGENPHCPSPIREHCAGKPPPGRGVDSTRPNAVIYRSEEHTSELQS